MKISTTTAAAAATATTATAATHGRVKRLKKLRALPPPPSSSSSSSPPPVPHRRRRTITQVTVTLVVLTMLCLWTGLGFLAFFRYAPSTATRMVGSLDCTFASSSPFSSITSRYTQQQTPPPPYNLSHPHPVSSTSPFNMFHTVTSRFMVGQPNQPTLARARYRLLETFCFPTMLGQTRQNFFWLVLVDPRIDGDVLRDIQTLLSSMPTQNAFMVLTQNPDWAADGVGVPGVESYGVGLQELGREYEAGRVDITTGNTTFLLQALDVIEDRHRRRRPNQVRRRSSPQSRDVSSLSLILLLETLLDADDGMHTSGIQRIQDTATQHTIRQLELMDPYNVFEPTTKVKATTTTIKTSSDTLYATDDPISLNETWWLMCGTDHIEWHNRDIYQLTLKEYQEKGLSSGITGLRHAPVYCASAGYTRVGLTRPALSSYLPSHQRKDDQGREPTSRPENDGTDDGINNSNNKVPLLKFPRVAYSNHALTAEFAVCNDGLDSLEGTAGRSMINNNKLTTGLPFLTNEKGDEIRNGKNNLELISSKCFRRVFPNFPFVLKSRTITSDSMDHISVKQTDYRDLPWQDPSSSEYPLLINETEKTWQVLESDFNISRMKAWQTSLYLREHMEEILDENSKGRCAPGFPCREVANVQFKKIGMFVRGMKRKDAYEAQHKTIKAKKQ